MNFTPKLAIVALAVSVTFGLGACSKEEPGQEASKEPAKDAPPQEVVVKIGHAAPLTVKTPHLGKDNENGARLAIDEANAKGLSIDGKNIKFALVSEDDQGDPKVGTTVAQKLVDAKVAGVVGHLNSGVSIPASRIYNDAGIPMISGSSTNPDLTEQNFKVTFRVVGRDDQQGPAIANYLISEFKPKTVAIIDDASAYGKGLANEVEKTLAQAGVKVLPREQGTDTSTDFKPILTKIRGRKPDAVFYGGMDQTGGLLLKQGRELGIKAVFAFGDGACTEEMKKLAGEKQADGFVCSQAGIPVQAASKAFLDGYKAKFNVDPILYSPFTYDATNLLIAAMQKANSVDPAKYLSALAGISFQGASGRIEFDAKGDRKDAEMTIFTMKGGKLEPVAIVKSGTTTKFEEFMKAAAAAGTAAKEAGKEALDKAGDAAATGAAATKDAAGRAFDTAKDVAGKAVDATKETAKEVAKDVSQGVKQMGEDAKTAGKQISETAGKAVEGAKDLVKK